LVPELNNWHHLRRFFRRRLHDLLGSLRCGEHRIDCSTICCRLSEKYCSWCPLNQCKRPPNVLRNEESKCAKRRLYGLIPNDSEEPAPSCDQSEDWHSRRAQCRRSGHVSYTRPNPNEMLLRKPNG
jgi:hypothetical protein